MKRSIILIAVVALTLASLIYARSQKPRSITQAEQSPTPTQARQQQMALEKTVTTQQRLNRYFHGDVVPKLRNCWSRVQGKGTVGLKYTYTKTATGKWAFEKLEVDASTLPRGQDAVALKCMQDSVRGSSFPVEGGEETQNGFVINWTWPIPFPANTPEQTSAMFAAKGKGGGGGTGGCDGHGTTAHCYACGGGLCTLVCVGYNECSQNPVGCAARFACASGGPFGVSGGIGLYAY